ncbi:MAG: glyoxalase [Firmicutes bacterium]|nr:glyoxalase [Bacillota bacterium]
MKIKQVLNRFYVHKIEQSVEFYEKVLNEKCNFRILHPQLLLEIAQVGNILIISGSEESLKAIQRYASNIYSRLYC